MHASRFRASRFLVPLALALAGPWALAGGEQGTAERSKPAEPSPRDALALQQNRIADRYARLEQLMIRMAEIEAATNPERAGLLKRAALQSSERLTRQQLQALVRLLTPPAQLKRAIDEQQTVVADMKALLELLLSENRADRLKDEQARVREYLQEVERLLRLQRGVQGRTEGGDDAAKVAGEQSKVADRTGQLAKRIQENEEKGAQAGAPESAEPSKSQKPNAAQGDAGPGAQGKPGAGEGQPSQGSGAPKQPADQPPPVGPAESPARNKLQQAEQRMRAAQQRLEEAQRQQAVEEQEKARQELEQAKAELEQILRQLRQEELERALALLEARFRRMLEMQVRIYESTKQLDQIPAAQRGRDAVIQAGRLSADENKLVAEADKALLLLREEGSSVAFPESVEQMRDDMTQVVTRLAASQVDTITQGFEEDIIAALEEMIQALQQAQKQQEEQRPQDPAQQPGPPQDMPLVDALSELKMIRALQMRVNTRTQKLARLLKNMEDPVGQAEDEELRQALAKLAEKQQRIHEVTRDIVLGKNR